MPELMIDEIESIEYIGEDETYSLEMADPYHNYRLGNSLISLNSHSVAYAFIAYQTAWLKANYPRQYMAALLSSVVGNHEKIQVYIDNCRRMNIPILPPDVNHSEEDFSVDASGAIRFGLGAVKNVGADVIRQLIAHRKRVGGFRDLNHFYAEVGLSLCNARVMESLIRAGCFDSMGVHRNGLLQQFPLIREAYSKAMKKGKKQIPGQTMLFQLATRFVADPVAVPECEAFTRLQCLADEREKIGTYVSGHPLDDYALGLPYLTTIDVSPKQPDAVEEDAEEGTEAPVAPWPAENELIAMAGILTRTRKITTRTTGAAMMLGEIQNKYGSIKVVFFPKTFEAYGDCLGEDVFVSVIGKFKMDGDTPEIMADKVVPLDQARVMVVRLPADMDGTGVLPIKAALGGGDTPVVFVNQHRPGEHVVAHPSLWVKPSEELEARIYRLCRGVTLEVRRLF